MRASEPSVVVSVCSRRHMKSLESKPVNSNRNYLKCMHIDVCARVCMNIPTVVGISRPGIRCSCVERIRRNGILHSLSFRFTQWTYLMHSGSRFAEILNELPNFGSCNIQFSWKWTHVSTNCTLPTQLGPPQPLMCDFHAVLHNRTETLIYGCALMCLFDVVTIIGQYFCIFLNSHNGMAFR